MFGVPVLPDFSDQDSRLAALTSPMDVLCVKQHMNQLLDLLGSKKLNLADGDQFPEAWGLTGQFLKEKPVMTETDLEKMRSHSATAIWCFKDRRGRGLGSHSTAEKPRPCGTTQHHGRLLIAGCGATTDLAEARRSLCDPFFQGAVRRPFDD